MPNVSLNGHTCHYEIYGTGPLVLYMHGGFGGSSAGGVPSTREPWIEALAEHCQLIVYDRRSAGRSSAPVVEHTLDLFCADALALLDYLGVQRATVWGQSAGCAVAITLALSHPDVVRSLVLSDGAPWFTRDEELVRRLVDRLHILETEGAAAAYEARRVSGGVGLQLFNQPQREVTGEERAKLTRQRDEMRARLMRRSVEERVEMYAAELRTQKAYVSFDASERIRELHMPVLVVNGTNDRVFADVPWADYASLIPNLMYCSLEGASHGCGRSPEGIALVIDFLSAHVPASDSHPKA